MNYKVHVKTEKDPSDKYEYTYYTKNMNNFIRGTKDRCKFDCTHCKNQVIGEDDECNNYKPHWDTWGICLNYKPEEKE